MAAPIRRRADALKWTDPSGNACSLTPMSGGRGLLEIELQDSTVMIHSRNCLLIEGGDEDSFTELAEFEATLSLHRCQINWKFEELKEDSQVERSAYFAQ